MAETREVFPILELATGEGAGLARRQEGDAGAAQNGAIGFAFKDSNGDVILPQLNADGTLPVSFDSGTPDSNSAAATIAALSTEQDVVAITVANNDVVKANMAMGSAFQPMLWVLYHDNNGSLNELSRFVTGPGDFSHLANLSNIQFTAGATGTQRLVLRATQLRGPLTDAHGTISLTVA